MTRRPRISLSVVLLVLVVVVLAGTSVLVYLNVRTDVVTQMVEDGETIRVLLVAEEDGTPLSTQVLIYNPKTNRAGVFDVPRDVGAILSSLDRVDGIASLYEEESVRAYREEIEDLLGVSIPFHLVYDMQGLERVVDLAEGLEVFVPESYQNPSFDGPAPAGPDAALEEVDMTGQDGGRDGGEESPGAGEASGDLLGGIELGSSAGPEAEILLPVGNVVLDGAKARLYLTTSPPGESRSDRIARRLQFTRRFLDMLGDKAEELRHEQVAPYAGGSFEKNFDDPSLMALLGHFALLDVDQMIQRRIQGNFRTVDSDGESKQLLFPHFEGEWLRQSVRQVENALASEDGAGAEAVAVSIELLNGTSVSGLARRTRELYAGYGFDVVSVDNADSEDVEHTRVIDRSGNIDVARRVANIIGATRIDSEPLSEESTIDVTVILGQDFDGTYVRE
ncbi:MAG: LCP family protein [Spirochaetaceae bacterium]